MFYYYGGKKRLARYYPAPRYTTVVEPFAGGAAYSMFHLDSLERVILIEKDERVVETWQRVLAMTPEEVLSLKLPPAGNRTEDFLYMTAAASSAIARCKGMKVTPRMAKVVIGQLRGIAKMLDRAKTKVEVVCGDYADALDIEATWFVDPPYTVNVRRATGTGYPQGMGYGKGCDSQSLNYFELGDWCRERRGQVIVCEQAGATWLPFMPLHESGDSQGRKALEVCWHRDQ